MNIYVLKKGDKVVGQVATNQFKSKKLTPDAGEPREGRFLYSPKEHTVRFSMFSELGGNEIEKCLTANDDAVTVEVYCNYFHSPTSIWTFDDFELASIESDGDDTEPTYYVSAMCDDIYYTPRIVADFSYTKPKWLRMVLGFYAGIMMSLALRRWIR